MRAVSVKRARQLREYARLRARFLTEHPVCEQPVGCGRPATEVHHRRGRVGGLLLAVEHWSALCRDCHAHVTEHPAEGVRVGYLRAPSGCRVTRPATALDVPTIGAGIAACTDCHATCTRSITVCGRCGAATEPRYSGPELAHIAGATYRMVDHWTRAGYLPETANDTGSSRAFTPADLDVARLVVALLREGFTVGAAFRVAREITERDSYAVRLADIYELRITVRDTGAES